MWRVVVRCLQSCRRRYQVASCTEVVMALRYISGVAVDSEVVVHLSTVPQWLLVVIPVPEDVQVVAGGGAARADQAFPQCWRIVVHMLYSIRILSYMCN